MVDELSDAADKLHKQAHRLTSILNYLELGIQIGNARIIRQAEKGAQARLEEINKLWAKFQEIKEKMKGEEP